MNRSTRNLLFLLAGIIALSAGYQARSVRQKPEPSAQLPETQTYISERRPRTSGSKTQLQNALFNSSGTERWISLVTTIERTTMSSLWELTKASSKHRDVVQLITLRRAALDPQHCLDTLLTERLPLSWEELEGLDLFDSESYKLSTTVFRYLCEEWSRRDPSSFFAAMDSLSYEQARYLKLSDVLPLISKNNALATLRLSQKQNLRSEELDFTVLLAESENNPGETIKALLSTTGSRSLKPALTELTNKWGKSQPEEALEFLIDLKSFHSTEMRQTAYRAWISQDFSEAKSWFMKQPSQLIKTELISELMQIWGEQHPHDALEYATTQLSAQDQVIALTNLILGASKQENAPTLSLLSELPTSTAQRQVTAALAHLAYIKNTPYRFDTSANSHGPSSHLQEALAIWISEHEDPTIKASVLQKHGHSMKTASPYFWNLLQPDPTESQ